MSSLALTHLTLGVEAFRAMNPTIRIIDGSWYWRHRNGPEQPVSESIVFRLASWVSDELRRLATCTRVDVERDELRAAARVLETGKGWIGLVAFLKEELSREACSERDSQMRYRVELSNGQFVEVDAHCRDAAESIATGVCPELVSGIATIENLFGFYGVSRPLCGGIPWRGGRACVVRSTAPRKFAFQMHVPVVGARVVRGDGAIDSVEPSPHSKIGAV